MSIEQYGKNFPILLRTPSPRGKVELLETIGKGNYGYVYRGRLVATKETTAVKVVFLKEDELKETLLEMDILRQCNHPGITRYMGCFLKGLDLWICMEYCGGGALDTLYRTLRKNLNEDQIASILYDTVSALDYLHREVFLIHRDIKAGNVFITENGDFGVSAKLKSSNGRARTFIGTPYWMAPEVIMTDPESSSSKTATYDTKADIWSIGITAIEIAEKNPPLNDIHPMRALFLIPTSNLGLAKPKNWSKPFQDLIAECLIKDPNTRPTAIQILNHPFFAKAKNLDRRRIIFELVQKVRVIREKKKAGLDIDDEEDEKKEEIPQKVLSETMKLAKKAQNASNKDVSSNSKDQLVDVSIVIDNTFKSFQETQPAVKSVLLWKPITSVLKLEVQTGDTLDNRYTLIGTTTGLYFIDMERDTGAGEMIPLIRNIRFKQIEVVQEYGVLMALSGKHDHIRQYKLESLRKLIKYLTGTPVSAIMHPDGSQDKAEDEDLYKHLKRDVEDEAVLISKWTSDYIKILGTKNTQYFNIQKTETSIYMGALFRQDLLLFQWAKEPYLKFMKLKAFWLPETPKKLKLLHDGLSIKEICLMYNNESNLINLDDSKVKEVKVHKEFSTNSNSKNPKWETFSQIPFSDSKLKELRELSEKSGTINKKLLAVGGNTPKTNQVVGDRYFLATYDCHTRVTDIDAQPMIGSGVGGWKSGVTWQEPPIDLILRPIDFVIAIGKQSCQVVDWKSASLVQEFTLDKEGIAKLICDKRGGILCSVERKKRGTVVFKVYEPNVSLNKGGAKVINSSDDITKS
ncbi:hypothetical protein HK099_002207 [Clydaea vesicula]|uniref:non-specific serine/threonine protein kinase n=1 Tax=Clydaea vesicula TaxID=447962 RepID=A0AAD5U4H8_9FUNG|nr:hypothetical protein HK099_002207 [Clydaea vesicula]